jgi:hypothetical protein
MILSEIDFDFRGHALVSRRFQQPCMGVPMLDFLDGVAGPGYGAAILWTLAALIVLVIVLIIVKMIRSLTFGTFVAGGRNRKTRLAVMDATAVDSHRRLVLIRRDDIEHLLLIGGPTDVVVERDIRLAASRRPNLTTEGGQAQPGVAASRGQARETPPHQPASPPTRQGVPRPQPAPLSPVRAPAAPVTAPARPTPPADRALPAAAVVAPSHTHKPAAMPSSGTENPFAEEPNPIDDSLASELAVSLGETGTTPSAPRTGRSSLDDEMTKLLGELASVKR